MTRSFYTPPPEAPEEKAFLVGVKLPGISRDTEEENLCELALLARTAGAEVVGRTIQSRTRIDGSTYIGEGKVEELAGRLYELGANLVIFDDDLSPAQARNIESRLNVNVIDRTELILDIFARRARTRQARIQVEIAQLDYALPRLKRLWDHLSRQAGGIGTRGPGETQLEVDRRRVRKRISQLHKSLEGIRRGVGERRKKREDLFNVTIVGYTNAGKSTLLNRIAGSGVLESGQLFSTLDSTTRRVQTSPGSSFLLTDTVGFIRKLPTHLVASFRATLIDVMEADMLLHLADVSSSLCEDHIEVVNAVLEKVLREGNSATPGIPTVLVFNKIDLLGGTAEIEGLRGRYPDAVLLSAADGDGVEGLLERIELQARQDSLNAEVTVPAEDGRAISIVERHSKVTARRLENGLMIFDVRVRRKAIARLESAGGVRLLPGSDGAPRH